ncbi:polysaccharide deacetylase family protein [Parafrankia sp. EUN1f]|uniref:polysaccharide deacetylase family protein n=1 Tax=Parafrankia sp. EUN1f TaxID=102897 RepID=UPI0001C4712B|nr:polysaccharide deacetylase family protein [Parafrankia sp. EUN1f]EFC79798.1 polysaccharide deacetylase [Parafrankia sp. EUN1f]
MTGMSTAATASPDGTWPPGTSQDGSSPEAGSSRVALPVLMYHSIGDSSATAFRRWEVPAGALAEQLGSLAEHGYTVTSLSDALANPRERQVAITFDNGFEDFVTRALPVLAEFGARATLYVPTAYVGQRARWLEPYAGRELALLDWPALAALVDRGIEIGAHGHRHVELDVVPPAIARYDVTASMRTISEETGQRPESFSYPFGYHSPGVRQIVENAGFASACEVGYRIHRRSRSRFQVSRLIVGRSVGAGDILRLVTEGHRDAALAARRRFRAGWRAYRSIRWRLGVETA